MQQPEHHPGGFFGLSSLILLMWTAETAHYPLGQRMLPPAHGPLPLRVQPTWPTCAASWTFGTRSHRLHPLFWSTWSCCPLYVEKLLVHPSSLSWALPRQVCSLYTAGGVDHSR